VSPIANQTRTQNSVEGEISHFSTLIGGEPTADEIGKAIIEILFGGGDTDALGILYIIDDYQSIMEWAQLLRAYFEDEKADQAENAALGMLEERSLEILSSPLPSNPCGQYSNALVQLENLIMSALADSWLAEQINNRSCNLIVSPQYLFLDPGETWELTAELFDPDGNKQSCSSINWYSSNLNFVEITSAIDNTCIVTAVREGTANISANCDGFLGSASVKVDPSRRVYSGHVVFPFTISRYSCRWDITWDVDVEVEFEKGGDNGSLNVSGTYSAIGREPRCGGAFMIPMSFSIPSYYVSDSLIVFESQIQPNNAIWDVYLRFFTPSNTLLNGAIVAIAQSPWYGNGYLAISLEKH